MLVSVMEDLNKNQIVLLTLLVSFVTSIGTGIMTVSLLMEAPVEVTQTINRVVEKTIEKVTPGDIVTKTDIKKETTTVVVKEEDQVIGAIDKNTKAVVRIYEKNQEVGVNNLYGLGVVVTKDGIIATDKKNISEVMQYVAVMSDDTQIPLVYVYVDRRSEIGFFKAKPEKPYTFTPANLSSADPKLGQSIVLIGGDTSNAISVGRISSINTKDMAVGTSTSKYISSIVTDTSPVDGVSGGPALSLSGDLLGLSLSSFSGTHTFISTYVLSKEIELLLASSKSPL